MDNILQTACAWTTAPCLEVTDAHTIMTNDKVTKFFDNL